MRFIHSSVHGVLDYVLVAALVLVSIGVGLSGLAAAIVYLMAAALLVMTLITAFRPGALKLLPLPTHSTIELFMGMSLLVFPWIFGFAGDPMALNIFLVSGFALLALRLFSKLD
jgi:hypothetical protein